MYVKMKKFWYHLKGIFLTFYQIVVWVSTIMLLITPLALSSRDGHWQWYLLYLVILPALVIVYFGRAIFKK